MRIKTAIERLPWPTPKPPVQIASLFFTLRIYKIGYFLFLYLNNANDDDVRRSISNLIQLEVHVGSETEALFYMREFSSKALTEQDSAIFQTSFHLLERKEEKVNLKRSPDANWWPTLQEFCFAFCISPLLLSNFLSILFFIYHLFQIGRQTIPHLPVNRQGLYL